MAQRTTTGFRGHMLATHDGVLAWHINVTNASPGQLPVDQATRPACHVAGSLKAHWDQLAAIDFTIIEVWTTKGLVTYYLLFAMHLATRRVQFVGCTANPGGPWMMQMARNLTDAIDGFLLPPIRYLLLDRDTKFTAEFQALHKAAGVEPVLLPPRSPNCNAFWRDSFARSKRKPWAA